LDDLGSRIRFFRKGAAKAVGVLALPMVLVLGEPDFGSSMVMALTGGVLLFVAGMLMKHIFMIGGFGAVGCISFFLLFENRRRRIAPWLPDWLRSNIPSWFPWREDFVTVSEAAKTTKDQLNHALVAIRNGGDMGVGFGNSMQKQMYLPENHTDFIFAIGAEEWGLVFSLLLLALFVTVFVCGVVISAKSCDRLGKFIAFGISFLIFFQVLFNIGVVTGLLPTKGLALPLISYGGTNLMSTLISIGILMNVSRQSDLHRQREKSRISAVFHNKGGL
jgi:cell division protein FtsW